MRVFFRRSSKTSWQKRRALWILGWIAGLLSGFVAGYKTIRRHQSPSQMLYLHALGPFKIKTKACASEKIPESNQQAPVLLPRER